MNYTAFKKEMFDAVKALAKERIEAAEVSEGQNETMKRGKADYIMVRFGTQRREFEACPVFYYTDLYEEYEKGVPISQLAEEFLEMTVKAAADSDAIGSQVDRIYGGDLSGLHYMAVNPDMHEGIQDRYSCRMLCDLPCIPAFQLNIGGTTGVVRVDKTLQKRLGLTEEMMFEAAEKNSASFHGVRNVLELLMPSLEELGCDCDIESPMWVIQNGMAGLLYEDVRCKVAGKIGNSIFYVIPSSVDECIVIPVDRGPADPEKLRETCREVNSTEVKEENVLGDNIYICNAVTGKLSICNSVRERNEILYGIGGGER